MGMLSRIGCPEADAEGTFHVECKAVRDEVHLVCRGHSFAVCKVVDGKPMIGSDAFSGMPAGCP